VQISLGGVISLRYELLSGAVSQQALYFWTESIELTLAWTFGTPQLQSLFFLKPESFFGSL
jgi:hypothetical protein